MPLQKNKISIPFAQGIDTKQDPYQLQQKLSVLENGVFDKLGAINKRNAFKTLGLWTVYNYPTKTVAWLDGIYAVGNQVVANGTESSWLRTDGGFLYGLDQSGTALREFGPFQPVDYSTTTIGMASIKNDAVDHAYDVSSNCFTVCLEKDGTGYTSTTRIKLTVHDPDDRLIYSGTIFTNYYGPRVIQYGTGVCVLAKEYDSATNIKGIFVTVSGGAVSLSSAITITSASCAGTYFDACSYTHHTLGVVGAIVYMNVSGGGSHYCLSGTIFSGTNGATKTDWYVASVPANDSGRAPMTIFPVTSNTAGRQNLVCAWSASVAPAGYGPYYCVRDEDAGAVVGATAASAAALDGIIDAITGCEDFCVTKANGKNFYLFCNFREEFVTTLLTYPALGFYYCGGNGTTIALVDTYYNQLFTSKAFTWSRDDNVNVRPTPRLFTYAINSVDPNPQFAYQVTHIAGNAPATPRACPTNEECVCLAGKAIPTNLMGYSHLYYRWHVGSVQKPSTDKFSFAGFRAEDIRNVTNDITTIELQRGVVRLDLDYSKQVCQSTVFRDKLYLATGGRLVDCDNRLAPTNNFTFYPHIPLYIDNAASGGHLDDGSRYYKVTYEWVDSNGQLHRSAPSGNLSVTTSAGGSTQTASIRCYTTLSEQAEKAVEIAIVLWRTTKTDHTIYYRLPATCTGINVLSAHYVDIVDTYTDASITPYEQLYTQSEISNFAPPATGLVASTNDRLWIVNADDPCQLMYSKPSIDNQTAVEFAQEFFVRVDRGAGGITAIAGIDDKLVIFKESYIYYIYGQGPEATGLNGSFSQPIEISSDVGCIEPRSVVYTDAGIFFQSAKGIFLLGKNLQLAYVGAPVEDFTNLYTITSAVKLDDKNQVRFTMSNGQILVFFYDVGQWGTFKFTAGWSVGKHSCVMDGSQYITGLGATDSYIYREYPGEFLDYYGVTVQPIQMRLVTGWLSFADLQGFQRVWWVHLLGQYKSYHQLYIKTYHDFSSTVTETINPIITTISSTLSLSTTHLNCLLTATEPGWSIAFQPGVSCTAAEDVPNKMMLVTFITGVTTQSQVKTAINAVSSGHITASGGTGSSALTTAADTVAYTLIQTVGSVVAVGSPLHVRFKPSVQKCTAMKFEIYDYLSLTGTGEALSLSGLAFEVGMKQGNKKLGYSNTL